jgi:hypothetical protein
MSSILSSFIQFSERDTTLGEWDWEEQPLGTRYARHLLSLISALMKTHVRGEEAEAQGSFETCTMSLSS